MLRFVWNPFPDVAVIDPDILSGMIPCGGTVVSKSSSGGSRHILETCFDLTSARFSASLLAVLETYITFCSVVSVG
jgi:hypothetical protein